jgi:flagellar FliL protein
MAEENNEARAETRTVGNKKSPVVLILVIVFALMLAGGAVAGYFMFLAPNARSPQTAAQPAPVEQAQPHQGQDFTAGAGLSGPMKTLESFIVNLTDAQGTRYLKVVMQLEMSNDLLGPEIDRKTPQIRDEIIMLLSSKSFDDVSTIAGKRALKRGILNSVNKYLTSGRVLRVYFSDFVVQ